MSIVFYVNQTRHELVEGRHTHQTLLEYVRNECFLKGSKQGCSEGGCGACTMMISRWDEGEQRVTHSSVNACITPICSLDGCQVVTVEGIGDQKNLHPVQRAIAELHGSQCGFCTPGFVMSLYTAVSKGQHTAKDLERAFEGNLCRCTGYRPLLDAAKTFATDIEECYTEPCQHRTPSGMCSTTKQKCDEACKKGGHTHNDGLKFIEFPKELKEHRAKRVEVKDRDGVWYQPSTLAELKHIVDTVDSCLIVGGNAGYRRVAKQRFAEKGAPPNIIWPQRIQELRNIVISGTDLRIGSAVTITEVIEYLEKNPAVKGSLHALYDIMHKFGGAQIRNSTSLGGHVLSRPSGDLVPVLCALGSSLVTVAQPTNPILLEAFLSDRIPPKTIVTELVVPIPDVKTSNVVADKVSHRRDNSIGIVVGTLARLGTSSRLKLYFNGFNWGTTNCTKTTEYIETNPTAATDDILRVLNDELKSVQQPNAEGNELYRRAAALSMFFRLKTLLDTGKAVGANFYENYVTHAMQEWEKSQGNLLTARPKLAPSDEQVREPVGEPIMTVTGYSQACGQAIYVDDIPEPQGCLHAALVKSTVPHAKVISTDESEALKVPGVVAYFDQRHLAEREKAVKITAEKVFATGEVTCVGMVIGVIVAQDQATADRAATMVRIQYEPLPALFTIQDAIAAKSYFHFTNKVVDGDPDAAFADPTSIIVSGELNTGGQEHFYMEPHALLAIPGELGDMEILSCTQCVTKSQSLVAGCLGVPRSKVNVRVKRIGGAFGGKEVRSTYTSGVLSIAAAALKRPVRWLISREEDMLITGGRHPYHSKYRAAYAPDGSIRAIDVDLYSNGGNTSSATEEVMNRALMHIANAYKIPNVRVRGILCYTNLPSNTAFRGFGAPQAMMVMESIIEQGSFKLKIPVEEIRRRHLFQPNTRTHYGQLVSHSHLDRMWGSVQESSKYAERKIAVEKFNQENRWIKRGIALIPTMYGINFPLRYLNQAGALVIVYVDGTVAISHSAVEMGQGVNTKMAQIAARAFGIPVGSVHVADCASDKVPNTPPTAASVGADLNGMAVLDGCEQIIERLKPIREKNPQASFAQICELAWKARIPLSAEGFYSTDRGAVYDWKMETTDNSKRGDVFNYYTFGVACSEVEVDVLSGMWRVRMSDLLMDCGDTLNAAIDIGQVESSFLQGQGWLTSEELMWGDSAHPQVAPGTLHNATPHGYKIPSPMDVPLDFRVRLLSGCPNPSAVHSSKAVGEPPFFLSASVFFALKEAIYAARKESGLEGYVRVDSPLTVERIRLACRDNFTTIASGVAEDIAVAGSF